MRRRFKWGSTLRDLQETGGQALSFVPRPSQPTPTSGVATTQPASVAPGSLQGIHYGETRNVLPFTFDDSIDPTYPLDCFFQMPVGVLKIYSAKLWVKPAPFRAYETAASSGGGSTSGSGGGQTSSDELTSHSHLAPNPTAQTSTDSGHSHTYTDAHGQTSTQSVAHAHTVSSHTHSTPNHSHGITYGIFESAAGTGTLSAKVANDGVTFGSAVATGSSISAVDIKSSLTTTAGDRQLRIETSGSGVQARVKVLLLLDVLLKVDIG